MPRSNAFLTALVVGDQGTGALVSRSSSHVNSCMHEWYQHKYGCVWNLPVVLLFVAVAIRVQTVSMLSYSKPEGSKKGTAAGAALCDESKLAVPTIGVVPSTTAGCSLTGCCRLGGLHAGQVFKRISTTRTQRQNPKQAQTSTKVYRTWLLAASMSLSRRGPEGKPAAWRVAGNLCWPRGQSDTEQQPAAACPAPIQLFLPPYWQSLRRCMTSSKGKRTPDRKILERQINLLL